jgi:hypothetical protein
MRRIGCFGICCWSGLCSVFVGLYVIIGGTTSLHLKISRIYWPAQNYLPEYLCFKIFIRIVLQIFFTSFSFSIQLATPLTSPVPF